MIFCAPKDSKWPEPPPGHKWKKVQHDNQVICDQNSNLAPNITKFGHLIQVTWLASWTENVQNQIKYVMLNPSSKLKGEKDMMKYEKARMLKKQVHKIREDYTADFKSKEMRVRSCLWGPFEVFFFGENGFCKSVRLWFRLKES